MYGFLLTIHIIVCLGLILVVLLQVGKGASVSGLLGASSSNESVFGGTSTPLVVRKITVVMAAIFMITSIALTMFISKSRMKTLAEKIPVSTAQPQQPTQQQTAAQQPAPAGQPQTPAAPVK